MVKVLDHNGAAYYASRNDGLPDMEVLGMLTSQFDDARDDMRSTPKRTITDPDPE
jgi:hypothetical protein